MFLFFVLPLFVWTIGVSDEKKALKVTTQWSDTNVCVCVRAIDNYWTEQKQYATKNVNRHRYRKLTMTRKKRKKNKCVDSKKEHACAALESLNRTRSHALNKCFIPTWSSIVAGQYRHSSILHVQVLHLFWTEKRKEIEREGRKITLRPHLFYQFHSSSKPNLYFLTLIQNVILLNQYCFSFSARYGHADLTLWTSISLCVSVRMCMCACVHQESHTDHKNPAQCSIEIIRPIIFTSLSSLCYWAS